MGNSLFSIITFVLLSSLPFLTQAIPTPQTDALLAGFPFPCNGRIMRVRKDFDTMAPSERKAYTNAIKCIMSKPSQLDQTLYPAATNRYMDYAVIHVQRTRQVHLSGFFLTWHRYFLQLFERDLAIQCGYRGPFPYWNWPATANNLRGSPIFDGSAYSMSGDGEYVDTGPVVLSPTLSLPHGSGGGCVTTGPFANMTITMKNIPTRYIIQGLDLPSDAFALNPTCLTRDLNSYVSTTYTTPPQLQNALNAPNITEFERLINGVVGSTSGGGALALHSGAHFTIGVPGSSLYVSVQDPIWWPLHAMLDNVYTAWQARHPELATSLYGTETALNVPPSPEVTLETVLPDWGYFQTAQIKIGQLMSTTSGPFCYRYENTDF